MAHSWTPRRRGNIYCASACGRGCTIQENRRAHRIANAMAKNLGRGWRPEVSENLGWHPCVISESGRWKVWPTFNCGKVVGYTAFLGKPGCGGIWAEYGRTAKSAIKKTKLAARATLIRDIEMYFDIMPLAMGRERSNRRSVMLKEQLSQ